MVKLVNLSNIHESKLRSEGKLAGPKAFYLEEYRGLDVLQRAKKAALSVSDNGRCWWIYDWVYRELTWRDPKCD
tara:strand:- start:6360 stop:6581 length:222 start_codon:yes stop_codon:yes gene_type:complete